MRHVVTQYIKPRRVALDRRDFPTTDSYMNACLLTSCLDQVNGNPQAEPEQALESLAQRVNQYNSTSSPISYAVIDSEYFSDRCADSQSFFESTLEDKLGEVGLIHIRVEGIGIGGKNRHYDFIGDDVPDGELANFADGITQANFPTVYRIEKNPSNVPRKRPG